MLLRGNWWEMHAIVNETFICFSKANVFRHIKSPIPKPCVFRWSLKLCYSKGVCGGCDETFKDRWVWYSLALPCLGLWRSRWTVIRSSVFTACKSSCSFPILFNHTLKHPLSHMQSWLYFYIQCIFRGPGDHNGAVSSSVSSPYIVKRSSAQRRARRVRCVYMPSGVTSGVHVVANDEKRTYCVLRWQSPVVSRLKGRRGNLARIYARWHGCIATKIADAL